MSELLKYIQIYNISNLMFSIAVINCSIKKFLIKLKLILSNIRKLPALYHISMDGNFGVFSLLIYCARENYHVYSPSV